MLSARDWSLVEMRACEEDMKDQNCSQDSESIDCKCIKIKAWAFWNNKIAIWSRLSFNKFSEKINLKKLETKYLNFKLILEYFS